MGKNCNIDNAYYSLNNVELYNKEIVNVYDEFMKLKDEGVFKLVNDETILKDVRSDYENHFKNQYLLSELSDETIEYLNKNIPEILN